MNEDVDKKWMPFVSLTLFLTVFIGGLIVIPVVFWLWPDSIARQLIVVFILALLGGLLLVKDKLQAGFILFFFSTQFSISLYTYELAQPAVLQFFAIDGFICLLFIIALEKRFIKLPDTAGWMVIIFLGWCCLTSIASAHPQRSIVYDFWLLKYLFIYLFFRYIPKPFRYEKPFYYTCAAILLFQSMIGFIQYLHGGAIGISFLGELPDKQAMYLTNAVRVSGTFGVNGFAGYLSMLLVVVFSGAVTLRSYFLYGAGGLGVITLLITFSRAGWVSFFGGMFMVFALLVIKKIIPISKFVALCILGSLFMATIIAVNHERVVERFTGREDIGAIHSRITAYEQGIDAVSKYFMLGIGPGVTELFGAWNNNDKFIRKSLPNIKMGNQVHNGFLQVMIETGILGFVIWIFIVLVCIKVAFLGGERKLRSKNAMGLHIATSVGALVFLIHICFGTEMNNYRLFLLYCSFWGLSRNIIFTADN